MKILRDTGDRIVILGRFNGVGDGSGFVQTLRFADDAVRNLAAQDIALETYGRSAGEALYGYNVGDRIDGGGGNDTINGYGGIHQWGGPVRLRRR